MFDNVLKFVNENRIFVILCLCFVLFVLFSDSALAQSNAWSTAETELGKIEEGAKSLMTKALAIVSGLVGMSVAMRFIPRIASRVGRSV